MKPHDTDWHGIAQLKLARVMGEEAGGTLAASVLTEIHLTQLTSAAELRRFAQALSNRGGFASAVAALLVLHATMHEDAA